MAFSIGCTSSEQNVEPTIIVTPTLSKPTLKETALSLKGETEIDTIFNIWKEELSKNWKDYNFQYYNLPLMDAWYNQKGDCTDRTNILVTMLQADGINAYPVHGCVQFPDGTKVPHDWTRVKIINDTKSSRIIDIDLIGIGEGGERIYVGNGFWKIPKGMPICE
ncbi:MAG: transglutaminase-like domain-containing protein [Thermoplasmata archaeon]|nr:transglutaminase-like domain-containing protein [Thermoplasmata archaeon]